MNHLTVRFRLDISHHIGKFRLDIRPTGKSIFHIVHPIDKFELNIGHLTGESRLNIRVFLFVTYREFATRFELKVVVFRSQCNFSSHYRVLNYLTYRYTLTLKQIYFNFRRY